MKVSSKYIFWAHGPAAEDGNAAAQDLVILSEHGSRAGRVPVPAELHDELVAVAEIWSGGEPGVPPFYTGEARRILRRIG